MKSSARRVILLIMDSFGVGAAPDADRFQDVGADTLGHIAEYVKAQRGYSLSLPHLSRYGLEQAYQLSTGKSIQLSALPSHEMEGVEGAFGVCHEVSFGKDTPSGHWEIAGVPVESEWGYFPLQTPCFPKKLIQELITRGHLPGVLGEKHASGTTILEELGDLHVQTGKPIVYTSDDSVFQIAAHETHFGLDRLYALCQLARELVDEYHIGRVIARPFTGESGHYRRTGNRKDLAVLPPKPTLLDRCVESGVPVIGIGKISDIYAHQGVSHVIKADGNTALFEATLQAVQAYPESCLIMTNFVDFDSHYGHRRDVKGYAQALELFDAQLPLLESLMGEDDLLVITADHGCDPTWPGTGHTRENIPALFWSKPLAAQKGEVGHLNNLKNLGLRTSFADIGQTVGAYLGVSVQGLSGTPCFI